MAEKAHPGGRPTKYRPEFCNMVMNADPIRSVGATDSAIADALGIDRATVFRWREEHPEFAAACAAAKEIADDRVEASLFERANGYSHPAVKIFMPQGAAEPVYAPYTERYAPDTGAAFNWLKNRRPHLWRDRVEHTGADGGPIRIASALEEARRRAAIDVPFEEVRSDANALPASQNGTADAREVSPSLADALKAKRKP